MTFISYLCSSFYDVGVTAFGIASVTALPNKKGKY